MTAPTTNGVDAIARAFARACAEGRAALVPFLAAGDPDPDSCVRVGVAAAGAGADLIELGLPYPDSLADGPVIQAAYARALAAGMDTDGVFACARRSADATTTPVVLMTAYNPIHVRGADRFLDDAMRAGVAGVLVPDLPLEDGAELRAAAAERGLAMPLLVAPDTTHARAAAIARAATGFVYLVRRRGVTGAGGDAEDARTRVRALREAAAVPIVLGFGIRGPADVAAAAPDADGVVVGSALVDAIAHAAPGEAGRVAAREVAALVLATQRRTPAITLETVDR